MAPRDGARRASTLHGGAHDVALAVAVRREGLFLAAVGVAACAVALGVRAPLARRHRALVQCVQHGYRGVARDLGHALRAVDDLQAHGLAGGFGARVRDEASTLAGVEAEAITWGAVVTWLPIVSAAVVLAAFVGDRLASRGVLKGLLEIAALGVLAPPAIALGRSVVQRGRQRLEAIPLDRLLALPEDAPGGADTDEARCLPETLGPVAWERVTFRYPPHLDVAALAQPATRTTATIAPTPVLDGVTIRWSGSTPLVLVGPNGSGKSTLVALLLRLADPDEGRVAIGGVDLRALDLAAYRARVAYVPQRPLVLEGMRVGDAVRLVAPSASEGAIRVVLGGGGLDSPPAGDFTRRLCAVDSRRSRFRSRR